MKKVLITGGSGFLGESIVSLLLQKGCEVVVLDMRPPRMTHKHLRFVRTNLLEPLPRDQNFKQPYGVINLAGKRIFGRWNQHMKTLIYDTRVKGTQNLINLFADEQFRPAVLVSASAVGYYGDRGKENLREDSAPGATYLSQVAADWEKVAWGATEYGVRVALMRNGHILDKAGGLLGTLLPYYKWGIGGPLGGGRQYFPWVSRSDAAQMYVEALLNVAYEGPVNVVAPDQVTNREFSYAVAKTLRRPHIFSIPRWALRLLYGEFADEMLVSAKVYPKEPITNQFDYQDRELTSFLRGILCHAK